MTDTPIADGIHHRHETPQARPVTALQAVADAFRANALAARLIETGIGQRLSDADVETVIRVAVAIELARIEVPDGYRPERPGDVARDMAHDGLLSPDVADRVNGILA